MTRRTALACALSSFALASSAWAVEKPAAAPSRPSVVASVGGVTIDASELEAAGGARLFTIYTQEYQLRKQLLDDIITKRLLETEAKSRGISLDELNRVEVEGNAIVVRGGAPGETLMSFMQALREIEGVERIALKRSN